MAGGTQIGEREDKRGRHPVIGSEVNDGGICVLDMEENKSTYIQ